MFNEQLQSLATHVPQDALDHPEVNKGVSCHICAQPITGGRSWGLRGTFGLYTRKFALKANNVYEVIGSPEITSKNAWKIFEKMSEAFNVNLSSVVSGGNATVGFKTVVS